MIITLQKPPSINSMYGRNGNRTYIRPDGVLWFYKAGLVLKSQWKNKMILGNVALYIKYYYCGRWDWDNGNKALSDLLTKTGVYKDDSQVDFAQIQMTRVPHRKDQKVELEIVY